MTLRAPSPLIVVDANIVVGLALGLRSRRLFELVSGRRELFVTERARAEILGRVSDARFGSEAALTNAMDALRTMEIMPTELFARYVAAAARALRNAVASRNGSERDAHVLALAWTLDADIWSHDRDFAGTGWPSWSSANLLECMVQDGT